MQKRHLTKRAPDAGDSAAISSSFLRLVIFLAGRLRRPCPSAGNANRWALAHTKLIHERQSITVLNEHTNFISFLSALHKDRSLYYEKLRSCSKAWTNL